jgi:hypothetical protein
MMCGLNASAWNPRDAASADHPGEDAGPLTSWSRLAVGDDGGETAGALLDKERFPPVLIQHLEPVARDPAGDRAGGGVHGMAGADRGGPGRPEHPSGRCAKDRTCSMCSAPTLYRMRGPFGSTPAASSDLPPMSIAPPVRPGVAQQLIWAAGCWSTNRSPAASLPSGQAWLHRDGGHAGSYGAPQSGKAGRRGGNETSSYCPLPALRPSCPGEGSCRPGSTDPSPRGRGGGVAPAQPRPAAEPASRDRHGPAACRVVPPFIVPLVCHSRSSSAASGPVPCSRYCRSPWL